MTYIEKIKQVIKPDLVLFISGLAALISAVFNPPTGEYLSYIDFKVIAILFCLMAVNAGIRELGALEVLAQKMLNKTGSVRTMSLTLILLCFFSSMLITNDVALITFIPFTIEVLSFAGKGNLIFIITMQTIAANLGSMLTPVGNPQNLYLYSFFNLGTEDFFRITAPIVIISFIVIVLIILLSKNSTVSVTFSDEKKIQDRRKLNIYIVLYIACLASVFGFFPYTAALTVTIITLSVTDRKILARVDYSLLITFVFFFVFVGNIGHINIIENIFTTLIKGKEMFFAVALSQIVSNVPAAVMLSSFTKNYAMLIAGTNIGGLGTLVASLASLISFKLYLKTKDPEPVKYLGAFTGMNLLILPALLLFAAIWYR